MKSFFFVWGITYLTSVTAHDLRIACKGDLLRSVLIFLSLHPMAYPAYPKSLRTLKTMNNSRADAPALHPAD